MRLILFCIMIGVVVGTVGTIITACFMLEKKQKSDDQKEYDEYEGRWDK